MAGILVNDAGGARLNHDAAVSYGTCAWNADQALDEVGALRTDAAPAPPVHAAPDMVPARLPRRYASRIDAIRAAAAWHAAAETEREALLATGGRGAGALWTQLPDRPSDLLGSAHFRVATLL